MSVFPAERVGDVAVAGALRVAIQEQTEAERVQLVIRSYDLKFWREDPGIATVQRLVTLGDRVRVFANVDGAGPIAAQFPRRSSLLKNVTPGCRIQIEVTRARTYPSIASA